jgi:glycosyltransferase involved in cell wall biosynthesis
MRLAVISHKICSADADSPSGFSAEGGFPLQIAAISELFDQTSLVVPCASRKKGGVTPIAGKQISVRRLSVPNGEGLSRKLALPLWFFRNGKIIWREIKASDAVHAPIPGDVGTIGFVFALLQKKPLFVRYCGNWLVERTAAEKFWKWLMERVAGGRNVMLATGGTNEAPSRKNPHIKWIFSTSMRRKEIENAAPRELPANGEIRLIIACRQEPGKGTGKLIESLPMILRKFPNAALDVVGGGSLLGELRKLAERGGVGGKVRFHGNVRRSEVINLMQKAHVFCFPTASEGFPKAVLEALACGLPVVSTPVSVLPQLIAGGNGLLIEAATAGNIAAAVAKICSDKENYRKMSECAIATARRYSLENWRDEIGDNLRRAWNVANLSAAVL